jgi:hypothetical protein
MTQREELRNYILEHFTFLGEVSADYIDKAATRDLDRMSEYPGKSKESEVGKKIDQWRDMASRRGGTFDPTPGSSSDLADISASKALKTAYPSRQKVYPSKGTRDWEGVSDKLTADRYKSRQQDWEDRYK